MRKHPSLLGRSILALCLMVGFYLLALGICGTLGGLVWFDLQDRPYYPKLWLLAVATCGIVLWSIWPRALQFPDPGLPLRETEQPQLWQLVREVAAAAGQRPPKDLFLVGEVNAFVAERGSRLGFGGSRLMGIGLPLLQVLTVPQLRSVIAHEFGHFHGGDTRLGPFLYRTRSAIGRTVTNLAEAESLLQKPFEWYGKLFLQVTFAISRAQEYGADALAVRLCGLEPVQSALRRINEVGALFDHYLDSEFLPVLNTKIRPPLAAGFQQFLGSPAMHKLSIEAGEQAMQAKGDRYDSHPPLPQRLAAAAAVEGAGTTRAAGPLAITLLQQVDATEAKLLQFLTGKDEVAQLPSGNWDQVCVPTLAASWAAIAREHARKLPALRIAEFAAQRPLLAEHAKAVNPQLSLDARPGAGAWMLATLLGHALTQHGWTLETGLGEPAFVVRGNARLEPHELGRALLDGKLEVATWAALCAEHGFGDVVFTRSAAAA
jgi:heat shock protein HtpX